MEKTKLTDRERLEHEWNDKFDSGQIKAYPEFTLHIDPKAAQREAWVSYNLMKLKHAE